MLCLRMRFSLLLLFVRNSVWEIFTYCCSVCWVSWKCARKAAISWWLFMALHLRVYLDPNYISEAHCATVTSQFLPVGAEKNHDKTQDRRCRGEEWKQPLKNTACYLNYIRHVGKVVVKRGERKAYWRRKNLGIPENSNFLTVVWLCSPPLKKKKDHRDCYSGLRTTDYFLNAKHSTVKVVAVYGPQIANDSALIGVTSSDRQSVRVF